MNPMMSGQFPVNPVNPAVNGGYYNPVQATPEPAAPAVPAKPVPPGWNDPPMLSSKPKVSQINIFDCEYDILVFIQHYMYCKDYT